MDNMPNMVQAPVEEPKAAEKPKQRLIAAAYEYLALFVYAASVVILLFTFLTRLTTVVGPSMENTLLAGQQLVVSDIAYDPEPGDIIVFHELGNYNEPIVKRVIATEGQVVDIDFSSWTLTVDGVVIDEPYRKVDGGALLTSTQNFPITVPEGKLFVMGDNRNHSSDSRNTQMGQGGFIDERQVLGRVILRLTPFDLFGPVD